MTMEKRKSIFFADGVGEDNVSSSDLSSFTKRGTITPGKIANAREGELSEMIDGEAEQKYQEIIELLVTGGYFRARISGLSPFDKVVGGMAWSITASNVDVDADLFFQENLNIKQKIPLSEELIKALNRMKCPFPLQAQHITKLNFVTIFPIIRWLIAKVIETREETGDLLRMYSMSMFSKDYIAPVDEEMKQSLNESCNFIENVEKRYKPSRKFKRGNTKATPIQTLLEYGKLHRVSRLPTTPANENSEAAKKLENALGGKSATGEGTTGEQEEEEKRIKQMMKGMKGIEGDQSSSSKVSGGVLKSFLPSDEITNLSERYGDMESNSNADGGKMMGEKLHRQKVGNLEKLIQQKNQELQTIIAAHDERHRELEELQLLVSKKQAFNERIIRETEKLDALETPENTKALQALRSLVLLNETLVAQEDLFKQSCKRQMSEYKQKIEALLQADQADQADSQDQDRQEQINQAFDSDVLKLKKLKLLLNKKNRDISLIQRFLDELPSRAELLQYQRQFVELSEQSSSKYIETRQYFTNYNTYEDKRTILENELSILNSIQSNYAAAMTSANNKELFIKSMDQTIDGIQQVLDKSESKWNIEKLRHNTLSDQYMTLLDQERNYFKLTKEFEIECGKNELLLKKLQELNDK